MIDPHDRVATPTAAAFIADWNTAAIRRNGGVVITPDGHISEETAAQIQIAEAAEAPIAYIGSPAADSAQHTPPTATAPGAPGPAEDPARIALWPEAADE
jgi:hypothetical protein